MVQLREPTQQDLDRYYNEPLYTMWSVFKTTGPIAEADRATMVAEVEQAISETGAEVRGFYDVAGFRADADLMVWFMGESADQMQAAYHAVNSSRLPLDAVWSNVGTCEPSEFNKTHLPGFLLADGPAKYLTVYPFVRSYDWYLLADEKRRQVLRDHGRKGAGFPDIISSTVSAFGLGDYEWLVSLEADDAMRLVQCLHQFRYTEARLFVREDTPFYTGIRTSLSQWVSKQPLR